MIYEMFPYRKNTLTIRDLYLNSLHPVLSEREIKLEIKIPQI